MKEPKPDVSERLKAARIKLDQIDNDILELISRRSLVISGIALIKAEEGLEIYQPERYLKMLKRLMKKAKFAGLDPAMIQIIWNTLHTASVNQQQMTILSKNKDNGDLK